MRWLTRWPACLTRCLCAALLAGAFGGGAPTSARPTAPAAQTLALAAPGVNLLLNPGAERGDCTHSGYDAMTLPGWQVIKGSPDAICYGVPGFATRPSGPARPDPLTGYDPPAHSDPPTGGRAYFSGGATGDAAMRQSIDVSAAAAAIDRGRVAFRLGGALGGWAGQNDRVRYGLVFHAAGDATLAATWLVAATNTDRRQATGFLNRRGAGVVPPGTRRIEVRLEFTWTAGNTTDGYADDLSLRLNAPVARPALGLPPSNVPAFDHVFFIFMENENYAQGETPAGRGDYIVGNPAAPYLNQILAKEGSLLGQAYATTHPSDPNYLAVTGGSTFGWSRNPIVGADRVAAAHLGDRLDAAGKTWVGYAAGMAYPCDTRAHNSAQGGYYLPDDEPFMLYQDVVGDPARCAAHNKPIEQLDTDLVGEATTPNFVWLAANDHDNMEKGGVATGDRWLSRELPKIFQSPAWIRSRSLLILAWDEGHTKAYGPRYPNHVAAYVLGSQGSVKKGYVSPLRYTDYSFGATICDALGVATLTSNDAYARRLTDVWTAPHGGGAMSTAISLTPRRAPPGASPR